MNWRQTEDPVLVAKLREFWASLEDELDDLHDCGCYHRPSASGYERLRHIVAMGEDAGAAVAFGLMGMAEAIRKKHTVKITKSASKNTGVEAVEIFSETKKGAQDAIRTVRARLKLPKCPWRIGMRAVVTSTTVLREWRDRVGIVKGIQEHEIKLELDGDGRPEVWFYKRDVAPLRRNVGRL